MRRQRRVGRRRGLMVGAAIGSARARRDQNADDAAVQDQVDPMEQLQKLAQLKNEGVLTDEEFQAQKKQILGM